MLEVIISFSDNVVGLGIRLLKIALTLNRENSKCYPKNEEHIIVSTS